MISASLKSGVEFNPEKPAISVLFQTNSTKEIRIAMLKGQHMKEHKTPFPIVVELFEGTLDFGVEGKTHHLNAGDILTLAGDVPHDLTATSNCIVRLSLSILDKVERVEEVVK